MIQMAIELFVNVKEMTELLKKALPDRKNIDRHMINNVRICARKKLELDSVNIEIDPNYFDPKCITSYRDIAGNYTKGSYIIIIFVFFIYLFGLF